MNAVPIHLLWIINDQYINNFITVYNECKKNPNYKITVLAVPHLGYDFANAITSDEIEQFLTQNGIDCINSWNQTTNQYLDLADLEPDYIFTTTPYDIYLPEPYRSDRLMQHGKLCSVDYGAVIIKWEGIYSSLTNSDYFKNASMFFHCQKQQEEKPGKDVALGYLKLDEYLNYGRPFFNPSKWQRPDSFKVVWKPRWTMEEGDSTLHPYLEHFYGFLCENKSVDFVFLSHPLLEKNITTKGFAAYYQKNINKLQALPNFSFVDSGDFLDTVLGADLLIADHSSTIAEYTITGKPIIYTTPAVKLNALGKRIIEQAYIAACFDEAATILKNLMIGIDPKKAERESNRLSYFENPPSGMSIAQYLLQIIEQDFYSSVSLQRYETKVNRFNSARITTAEGELTQLKKQLGVHDQQFNNQDWQIKDHDQKIKDYHTALILQDEKIQSLNNQIDTITLQNSALEQQIHLLQQAKITMKLKNFLRRLKHSFVK